MHNRSLSLSTSSASIRSFSTCFSSSSSVPCWLGRSAFASLSPGRCFASASFSARSFSRAPSLAWFRFRGVALVFLVLLVEAWHVQRALSCVRIPPVDVHVHVTIVELRVGISVPWLEPSQPRSQPYDRRTGRASAHPHRSCPSLSDPGDSTVLSKRPQKGDRSLSDWDTNPLSDRKKNVLGDPGIAPRFLFVDILGRRSR